MARGRILGGSSALPGTHPWMVGIYVGEDFCAGTLVASCWVVSAAHCFFRKYVAAAEGTVGTSVMGGLTPPLCEGAIFTQAGSSRET